MLCLTGRDHPRKFFFYKSEGYSYKDRALSALEKYHYKQQIYIFIDDSAMNITQKTKLNDYNNLVHIVLFLNPNTHPPSSISYECIKSNYKPAGGQAADIQIAFYIQKIMLEASSSLHFLIVTQDAKMGEIFCEARRQNHTCEQIHNYDELENRLDCLNIS